MKSTGTQYRFNEGEQESIDELKSNIEHLNNIIEQKDNQNDVLRVQFKDFVTKHQAEILKLNETLSNYEQDIEKAKHDLKELEEKLKIKLKVISVLEGILSHTLAI